MPQILIYEKINKMKVTYFKRVNYCHYGFLECDLKEILNMIKTGELQLYNDHLGGYSLKMITEAIRDESDCDKQNFWKESYLPAVCFNGVWNGKEVIEYSPYTALDFDYINSQAEMDSLMNTLKTTPYVVAVFRTFKGFRLKAIIEHDNTDKMLHKDMYEQLMNAIGLNGLDEFCKDLSRRNYLVWDENLWVNLNPMPFHYTPLTPKIILNQNPTHKGQGKSAHSIINILDSSWVKNHPEYWVEGNRANSIFKCACQFCKYGVPKDMAEDYFVNRWVKTGMSRDEILKQVRGAYNCEKFDSKLFN